MSARTRTRLPMVLAAALLAGCGKSSVSTSSSATPTGGHPAVSQSSRSATGPTAARVLAHTVVGSAGGITARMRAGTRKPRVGRLWPVHFTVTRGGRAVKASVSYEFLYAGQIVARRSHYTFTGRFKDTLEWPASSVGYPLTLRAVIEAEGETINLDYPVRVVE